MMIRMRKKALMLALLLAFSIGTIAVSKADDTISVGHGEQIVLTLRNDGLIGIDQTILMTSSKTVEGTFMMNMSLDGILVGEPEITVEAPVESGEVLWKVENNVTLLNVTIKTKVDPFKFRFATLRYVLNGSLAWDGRAWHFQRIFSSTAGSLAPPWIVVKVPKPSEFEDLSFEEMMPVPNVFLEEGSYYTLVWKSEAFLVENTSVTLVRLAYSSVMNWPRVFYRFGPPIITFLAGLAIKPAWTWVKKWKQGRKEESTPSIC